MKKGFTLAEILVSLGLIGVVAALTLPNLMDNTVIVQTGPKLAKSVTNFEQANISLLQTYNSDSLIDTGLIANSNNLAYNEEYANKLTEFMRVSPMDVYEPFENDLLMTKDGLVYSIKTGDFEGDSKFRHKYQVGELTVDINGPAKPNLDASDIFYFAIMDDGSLIPYGSKLYSDVYQDEDLYWVNSCAKETVPTSPENCAGHIFENNMEVLYK